MPCFTTPIYEANDCHLPAGSPAGGQFCSKVARSLEDHATYLKGLSASGKKALTNYTRWTAGMQAINTALRKGETPRPLLQRLQLALASVVDNAPSLSAPVTAWRGTSGTRFEGLKPGDVITLPGFSSGSLDKDVAARRSFNDDRPTLLKIETRRGVYIASASIIPNEKEFLLPHGSRAVVTGVERGARIPGTFMDLDGNFFDGMSATIISLRVR